MDRIEGDIWRMQRGILVHGCNAQGKMGAGAAAGFRAKFPQGFNDYEQAWRDGRLILGEVIFSQFSDQLWGASAITQRFYGRTGVHADKRAIEACFQKIREKAIETGLPVFFVRVGAGLGGLEWEEVAPIIERALGDVGGTLVDFPPKATAGAPARSTSNSRSGAFRPASAPPKKEWSEPPSPDEAPGATDENGAGKSDAHASAATTRSGWGRRQS
jgi:O-acetyl-ADP-ribose deacetylase (regulator of RNase III)